MQIQTGKEKNVVVVSVKGKIDAVTAPDFDLPPNLVPHLKLEFCHFMFFNEVVLLVLEYDFSMNHAA